MLNVSQSMRLNKTNLQNTYICKNNLQTKEMKWYGGVSITQSLGNNGKDDVAIESLKIAVKDGKSTIEL